MPDELSPERELELRRKIETDQAENDASEPSQSAAQDADPVDAGLHSGVLALFAGLFTTILAILYLTFSQDPQAVFMIVVSALYGVMYFGTPVILQRVSGQQRKDRKWSEFLSRPFQTNTGRVSGRIALVQICIIPAALTIFITGISIVIAFIR